jgi:hypothetical protein
MSCPRSLRRIAHICIAVAFAWCGQKDETFKWLEQAFERRESDVIEIKLRSALPAAAR